MTDSAPAPGPDGFSTPEVVALSGVTYRQIDHWRTRGYVTPSVKVGGPGGEVYGHRWSAEDVQLVRRIAGLIAEGYRVAVAVEKAREELSDVG